MIESLRNRVATMVKQVPDEWADAMVELRDDLTAALEAGRSVEAGDYAELLSVMDGLCDLANDKGAVIYNLGAKSKAARETVRRLIAAPANPAALFDVDWIIRHLDSPETAARSHHRGIDAIKHVANRLREKLAAAPQQPTGRSGEASWDNTFRADAKRYAEIMRPEAKAMPGTVFASVVDLLDDIAKLPNPFTQQPPPVGVTDAPGTFAWMAEVCRAAHGTMQINGLRNDQLPKVADWIASLSHQQPAPSVSEDVRTEWCAHDEGEECSHCGRRDETSIDNSGVDRFAVAMKDKLAKARTNGRGGWYDKLYCSQEALSAMLRAHVEKGDPRDVANFCMMLHQRGEAILPAPVSEPAASGERLHTMTQVRDRFGIKQPDPKPSSAIPHADAASGEGLLPCPFCRSGVHSYQQTNKEPANWAVRCEVCGAQCGPSASAVAARYNWNTRGAAPPENPGWRKAWAAVADTLSEVAPGWDTPDGTSDMERACNTIRRLTTTGQRYTQADINAEYTRGRCDGWEAAKAGQGDVERLVERLKVAARALIRGGRGTGQKRVANEVFAEDVETLADVLRVLEALVEQEKP